MPTAIASLARLPGVGRYTAGALASFAFDLPVAAIDANIARVLARLLDLQEAIDTTAGNATLWAAAESLLPKRGGRLHTSALMELGALICTPTKPACLVCPVRSACRAREPERLPIKRARAKTVALREDCAWVFMKDRVLLEQQTGSRWRGLWKLPALVEELQTSPLLTATYPFTHHRVTLRVFASLSPLAVRAGQQWFPIADLASVALAAPHRRAVEKLLSVG